MNNNFENIFDGVSELNLFLKGFKPAIIPVANHHSLVLAEMGYPNTVNLVPSQDDKGIRFYEGSYLYFQNADLRKQFIEHQLLLMQSISAGAILFSTGEFMYKKILGTTLGYPPTAVDAFAQAGDTFPDRVFINYLGLQFIDSTKNFDATMEWLKENYKVPKKHKGVIKVQTDANKAVVYKFNQSNIKNPFSDIIDESKPKRRIGFV